MHKNHPVATNSLYILFALALSAVIGLPAQAVADNGARNAPVPSKNMSMKITNKPPKCARGFKAIKIQKNPEAPQFHVYTCVSERLVCNAGHAPGFSEYVESKNRFEYLCHHPAG